jgi:hypothetical protein
MGKALLVFAMILAIQAAWVLSPEIFRTDVEALPVGPAQIAQAELVKLRAFEAAWLGWVRGDLWAESIYARSYLADPDQAQPVRSDEKEARVAALADCERALSLAPVTPGLWALCALLDETDAPSARADRYLEMSYYTGLNLPSVIPLRLLASGRSNMSSNDALQSFVAHDVGLVLTKLLDLKPSLVLAYKRATPQNRAVFIHYIEQNDPAFAAKLGGVDTSAH